jgi:hypothetical protein
MRLEKIWFNGKIEVGNVIGSVAWLAKLESHKLKTLLFEHEDGFVQNKVMEAIERKVNR